MLNILSLFGRASAKLMATFVTVIGLMLLGFTFFPSALNALSDFSNYLEGFLRDPQVDEQGKFLFRTLVNENTIFGILMTMIARSLVELAALVFGGGWKAMFSS